jgi:hypothetical protein
MVRADWAIVTGWQKLLLGIALCLPIPALSASGLALPLPSAVYSVAVAIVESTEGLAGAFTGGDRDARVLSVRQTAISIRQQPAQASRSASRVAVRTPVWPAVRIRPAVRTRTRSFDSAPARSRAPRSPQPSAEARARTPSAPVSEQRTEASTAPVGSPATPSPAQASAPEAPKERLTTDTTSRPAEIASSVPKVSPPPPTAPPASPPAPPPAPPPTPPPAPPAPALPKLELPLPPLPIVDPVVDQLPVKLPELRLPGLGRR